MKRMGMLILSLLLGAVLCGCGTQEITAVTESGNVEVTQPGAVTVRNVDELLAAIAPGAQIQMEEGRYVLSEAADYGAETENGCYFWIPQDEGYQLVLHGLQGLTIRGSGRATTVLETEPDYANVLILDGCAGVQLEGFTVGGADLEDQGIGLALRFCTDVSLKDLEISGCGTAGLELTGCRNVSLLDSEISHCGYLGILADQTSGLTVENCDFCHMGNAEYGGGRVFRLSQTGNVRVSGCDVSENRVESLIECYPCSNVVFEGNSFRENHIQYAVFDVDGGMIFDSNIFEGNNIANWFASDRSTVLDNIGKSWNGEMLQWYYQPPVETAPEGTRTEVRVATVDELLAAIRPNTEIVLEKEFYDLSLAKNYGTGYSDYYYWNEEFDGPSLIITDVDNLVIRSAGGDVKGCTISAVPRYANVLSFRRCSNVSLSGFTAGHTVEPGYCMGGVLYFVNCDNMQVENCGLYGCGILGVQADLCGGIAVKNCDIYECSYGGIQMAEVTGVTVENCTFRDLGGDRMSFYDCREVTVDGKSVSGNASIS